MAIYQLLSNGYIKKEDGKIIPNIESNSDYYEYLKWVSAGNTPDPIDIDDRRANVKTQARLKRDYKVNASISFDGKLFAGTLDAQRQLGALVASMTDSDSANFTADDGTRASYTKSQLLQILVLMRNKDQLAYNKYAELVAQINASTNPESINVNDGW